MSKRTLAPSEPATLGELARHLSAGLDLVVRARKLDEMMHHAVTRQLSQEQTRSMTVPIWVADQYEKDLADWEAAGRALLARLPLQPLTTPKGDDHG